MKEITKPFNEYATMHYKLAYSSNPNKRTRVTHWQLTYGKQVLTPPQHYSLCVKALNQCKMMGLVYPKKELLVIKPSK